MEAKDDKPRNNFDGSNSGFTNSRSIGRVSPNRLFKHNIKSALQESAPFIRSSEIIFSNECDNEAEIHIKCLSEGDDLIIIANWVGKSLGFRLLRSLRPCFKVTHCDDLHSLLMQCPCYSDAFNSSLANKLATLT